MEWHNGSRGGAGGREDYSAEDLARDPLVLEATVIVGEEEVRLPPAALQRFLLEPAEVAVQGPGKLR
jgi:hypothetical protein